MNKCLFGFAAVPLLAAVLMTSNAPADSLSRETKVATVKTLGEAMVESYVFPDLAEKIAKDLDARLKKGEYDAITEGPAFAKTLTDHMRLITQDAHLSVRFSDKPLPQRQDRRQPSKEEMDRYQKMMRIGNGGIVSAERLVGNVGYIDTTGFVQLEFAKEPIAAAMELLKNTDALIVDMRHNGGGSPDTVQFFCSYFFDEKPVHLNSIYHRPTNTTKDFYTLEKLPGSRYVGKDVYVLIGKRTASAAEEFSYNLQNLKRATLIGESTWGGANPGGVVRLNDHFSAFIPNGRAINPYTKTNWEGVGVQPHVKVPAQEALKTAHVAAIKKLLESTKDEDDKARLTDALRAAEQGQLK